MKLGAVYRVEWEDSCSIDGGGTWKSGDRVRGMTPSRIVTVGKVLAVSVRHVSMVSSWDDSGNVSGELCVPRSCIRRKKRLV